MPLSSSNINNSFFDGVYKDAWREIAPEGLTKAEADFILEIASLKNEGKVLDLMCGYGRHALELGRRGVDVNAIDNQPDYIKEINLKAVEQNLRVVAKEQDVLFADLDEIYDAVICMGNSFAFFNKRDIIAILKNISAHLKAGGVLIINSWMIAEIAIRYFKEKEWHNAGDYKCVLESTYCFNPSRIETTQTIISKDNTVDTVQGVDYIFTLDELEEMFSAAGLKTKALYSTPRKRKFALGDGQIYIVGEKL